MPTLVLYADDDPIVPLADSAGLSVSLRELPYPNPLVSRNESGYENFVSMQRAQAIREAFGLQF